MERFRKFFFLIFSCVLISCCFFLNSENTYAYSKFDVNNEEKVIKRSLESLRDFDYQTWQIIVYPSSKVSKNLILRIVGYPGSLRMDHPKDLLVISGRKNWYLQDITLKSKVQLESLNDSAVEFNLDKLIDELDKNRPLRLKLPGLINDLPIPPYLTSEWRRMAEKT